MSVDSENTDNISDILSQIPNATTDVPIEFDETLLDEPMDTGTMSSSSDTIHTSFEFPISGIEINPSLALNTNKNQILITNHENNRNVQIKKVFNKKRFIININPQTPDSDINTFIKEFIRPSKKYFIYFMDQTDETYKRFSSCIQTNFKNSITKLTKVNTFLEDIVDKEEQENLIVITHTGLTNHRGINETYNTLKNKYYWPNMKSDISSAISKCELCRTCKYDRNPTKPTFNLTPTEKRPMKTIHIDTLTYKSQKILSIIDSFSKFAKCYTLTGMAAPIILEKLLDFFSCFGIPNQIVADSGSEFKNNLIQGSLKEHNIEIHFTSINHPESNGLVERFHSTLLEHLRLIEHNPKFKNESPSIQLSYALIAYNNTTHSSTKLKPIDLINNYEMTHIIPTDLKDYIEKHREQMTSIYDSVNKTLTEEKEKRLKKINKDRNSDCPFSPDENVYVKRDNKRYKHKERYRKEKLVTSDPKTKTVQYIDRNNQRAKVHISRLQKHRK